MIYVQHIDPLNMQGDLVAEWTRFADQWNNYERKFPDLATMSTKRRAAIFLAWIGSDAFQFFRKNMTFERVEDQYDFDKVVAAVQRHCVGAANARRYIGAVTRPEEVWEIEPAPARSASPQRDHQSGRRDAIESATQPLLTVTTPAYPAAVSECAVTSSAAMDVTPSTRDSSTSQHRDNENGSDVEERMDRSSERCSEPTSGTTTAAAVEDALSPAAVNALPSVPERSASEREDHQTGCHEERRYVRESDRQYDDAPHATTSEESVPGRSEPTSVVEQPCGRQERGDEASTLATTAAACDDTCAASEENILAAADEPPCIRQREDEVMASPTEVSMFPSDPVTSASQCQSDYFC